MQPASPKPPRLLRDLGHFSGVFLQTLVDTVDYLLVRDTHKQPVKSCRKMERKTA
jgi:hypothetical protein